MKINKFSFLTLVTVSFLFSVEKVKAYTGVCTPDGGVHVFTYDATKDLQSVDNASGSVINNAFVYDIGDGGYKAHCDYPVGAPAIAYVTTKSDLPVYKIDGGTTWYKVSDYIAISMSAFIGGKVQSYFAVPFEQKSNGGTGGTYQPDTNTWASGGRGKVSLMIIRPYVGFSNVNTMASYTTVSFVKDSLSDVHMSELYLNLTVNVPQSCELDAGTAITMDFGNIGAPLFSQAGAGNKPAGVNPKTHTIAVKCKNIDAQALLSMRLESDSVSGNAMVSDNKDVGFVVSGSDKVPLTPNNIDSKIKFQLDDNSAATVPITAWPVSVTGNKPAEGRFTSEGYLRIDFD